MIHISDNSKWMPCMLCVKATLDLGYLCRTEVGIPTDVLWHLCRRHTFRQVSAAATYSTTDYLHSMKISKRGKLTQLEMMKQCPLAVHTRLILRPHTPA
ncbi:hypothetical protein MHYP_G00085090 [Metynnis hypsauchen]